MLLSPTVPDEERDAEITLEEAVNLLLKSIAMEEISLSKLLDVEREKVLNVLTQCRCGSGTLQEVLKVNRSVDDMVKNMTRLQMLLQFKLKNVQEFLPCTTLPPCPPEPCVHTGCSVMGEARGIVCNGDDPYRRLPVSVYTFFPCGDRKNGTLRYRLGDACRGLHLYACGHNVTLHCPTEGSHCMMMDGVGKLKVYQDQGEVQTGTAAFTLTVDSGETGRMMVRMELSGRGGLCLEHDSGWIKVDGQTSNLRIKSCGITAEKYM